LVIALVSYPGGEEVRRRGEGLKLDGWMDREKRKER